MECFVCRRKPLQQWWPELKLAGGQVVHNMVLLGEGPHAQWFMLEFPEGPFNSPAVRLRGRRIVVREEWFEKDEELPDYVRRKALEWLEREGSGPLLEELRNWRGRHVPVGREKHRQPWTSPEEQRLLEGVQAGASVPELARAHGRSWAAIRARLLALGVRQGGRHTAR